MAVKKIKKVKPQDPLREKPRRQKNMGAKATSSTNTLPKNASGRKKSSPTPAHSKRSKNDGADQLKTITPSGKRDESFFELVFEVARRIPKGRVTSYGAIAACLGTRLSARMVGWAMNMAHITKPKVPAHRVVNRNGLLTGKHHFATPTQMQELLEKEGTKVKNDTVVDFKKRFWDPAEEL